MPGEFTYSGNSETAMPVRGRNSNWAFIVPAAERIVNGPIRHFCFSTAISAIGSFSFHFRDAGIGVYLIRSYVRSEPMNKLRIFVLAAVLVVGFCQAPLSADAPAAVDDALVMEACPKRGSNSSFRSCNLTINLCLEADFRRHACNRRQSRYTLLTVCRRIFTITVKITFQGAIL